jgi:hypothetical protein
MMDQDFRAPPALAGQPLSSWWQRNLLGSALLDGPLAHAEFGGQLRDLAGVAAGLQVAAKVGEPMV